VRNFSLSAVITSALPNGAGRRPAITRADPDELFVLFRGFPYPIRCFAAPYFRYPNIALAMSESRFVRPEFYSSH
jgi:hypothetical protein